MATTVNLTRAGFAIISSKTGETNSNDHSSASFISHDSSPGQRTLLVKFANLSGNDLYREIQSATIRVQAEATGDTSIYKAYLRGGSLAKGFDPNTATHNNYGYFAGDRLGDEFGGSTTVSDEIPYYDAKDTIKYGFGVYGDADMTTISVRIYTNVSFSVVLENYAYQKISSKTVNGQSISASTVLSRQQPNTFMIELDKSSNKSMEIPEVSSVKFRYREKDADTYTEVNLGTELSYEMPGNLMPIGEMEIQWVVTDIMGHVETSDWTTVKTENQLLISTSPTGKAFVDRFQDALFGYTAYPGVVVNKFRYRKAGETVWTEKPVDNTLKGYTLPAGTITEGAQFEYAWVMTDRYGAEWQKSGYQFYTTDAISSCQIVEPVRTIVDADKRAMFRWRHIISTGSAQTKAELQSSRDGNTWADLATVESAETQLEFAGNTFSSGGWYWRVRTYNTDGVAGEWSAPAQFIAIGSPATPTITAEDHSPRPTIRWETNEQTAYEIGLDGITEKFYGSDKTWTSRAYLADGEHRITIRSQNQYDRWSTPGEIIITVVNNAGPEIKLVAAEGTLIWETSGEYDWYQIYRDLELIAETTERTYTDPVANGDATYQVRGCYDSSNNYGLSNAVETETRREYHQIYNLETGVTMIIQHCGLRNQTVSHSSTRDISMVHVPGLEYPVVERGEYRDLNINGAAVFFRREDAMTLEAMSGFLVCFMTPDGVNYTGVLNSVEITPMGLRTDCTFKLTKADGLAVEQTVSVPTFDIDVESGSLIMNTSDSYGGSVFAVNRMGDLEVRQ